MLSDVSFLLLSLFYNNQNCSSDALYVHVNVRQKSYSILSTMCYICKKILIGYKTARNLGKNDTLWNTLVVEYPYYKRVTVK